MTLIITIFLSIITLLGFLYGPDTVYGVSSSENILLSLYFDPFSPFRNYGTTFITSFFFHGDFVHFLSNIFLFFFSAMYSEKLLGKLKFMMMLLISQTLILTWITVTHSNFDMTIASYYLGPSGVIFSFIYFDLICYRKIGVGILFSLIMILDYFEYLPLFNNNLISHQAHIAGIVVGSICGLSYLIFKDRKLNRIRS